jgi:hypothetical protein|nr:MAG TPA: hypothetical protein [Caudoviricetes sp.]
MRQPSNVKREDRHAMFIVTMVILSLFFAPMIYIMWYLIVSAPDFIPIIKGGIMLLIIAIYITTAVKIWIACYKGYIIVDDDTDRGYK